ncbi:hypothetical protein C8R44DRAFT_795884 [Mycena epipterygia]|nr:hypothetical protein C8R44DRAFT_795884 [Mycena epipterygia]
MSIVLTHASPDYHIVDFSGPLIIALLLHWGLFGTLSVQIYLYYQAFPNDRPSTKCLVYTVYAIEFVQTILLTYDIFMVFGYAFGDFSALTKIYFDWLTIPMLSGLVAFIGQSFYAFRVSVLSKSRIIPWLIVVISLTSSVGAFITGAFALEAGNLVNLNNRRTSVAVGVWAGASALNDVIIAGWMTYYLSKQSSGFRQTRILVSKLIRLIIETGSLTAVVAVVGLTLFYAFPGRVYYTAVVAILPKLYANSILVVLNARFYIVGGRETQASSFDMISVPPFLHNTGSGANASGTLNFNPASSHVEIGREVFSDDNLHHNVELKRMDASHSNVSSRTGDIVRC